MMIDPYYQR